jgi:hypothetical protein
LYSPPNIFKLIKSRRMRWTVIVAWMGRWEMSTKFWLEILKGRDHSYDLDVDGRIILKWIFGKYGLGLWNRFIWLGIWTCGGLLWTR